MRGGARAGGAAIGLLLLAPSAAAHVTVKPASVAEGGTVVVALGTPNERDGHSTVALRVELPPEVEVVSAVAPAGWVVEHSARTATWSGGEISDDDAVEFPLELRGLSRRRSSGAGGAAAVRGRHRGDVAARAHGAAGIGRRGAAVSSRTGGRRSGGRADPGRRQPAVRPPAAQATGLGSGARLQQWLRPREVAAWRDVSRRRQRARRARAIVRCPELLEDLPGSRHLLSRSVRLSSR